MDTPSAPDPWRTMPEDVRGALSWLAHLIDASIPLRMAVDAHEYAQRFLGASAASIVAVTEDLDAFTAPLVESALADDMRETSPADVAGNCSDESPVWKRLELEGETRSVPSELVMAFTGGSLLPAPVVVGLEATWNRKRLSLFVRGDDADLAHGYLRALLERARGAGNYLRGRCLEAGDDGGELVVTHVTTPVASRSDLVVPDEIWTELDRNVHTMFRRRQLLAELGLGTNRGVMLYGPPGTGKSALCRVLAAELAGEITVVFCTATVMAEHMNDVYEGLAGLAPALVVLEDLDLVIGSRGGSGSAALHRFLTALDGAFSRHRDVVTVATTNDPNGLDPAARRAARFDRFVEVPLPATRQRTAILARYLGRLAERVDLPAVAAVTDGASGADLREVVRAAVIADGDRVSTRGLLDAAGDRGLTAVRVGAYL